jgi:hypothetical protein
VEESMRIVYDSFDADIFRNEPARQERKRMRLKNGLPGPDPNGLLF